MMTRMMMMDVMMPTLTMMAVVMVMMMRDAVVNALLNLPRG